MFSWPTIDTATLRKWRTQRVHALMDEHHLDHLVITSVDNIRYATDYRTQLAGENYDWFAAVIDGDRAAHVFLPWVDEVASVTDPAIPTVQSVHPLPSWTPAVPHASFWASSLASVMPGARRIGYELLYPEILDALKVHFPDADYVPIATELYDMRIVKHPSEIVLLEATGAVNANAAARGLEAAQPGMTDYDILAVIAEDTQRAGVEIISHGLCNHRRGTGTWFAEGTVLREGDPFFFDVGCYGKGGYASDIARTGFVGEPPKAVREAYAVLMEAYQVGQDAARPGVKASSVHNRVNGFLDAKGYPRTPYSMGHGVGLRLCELPTIHRADRMARDQVLIEGSVIALEPETGVEVDGEFMLLKIEDNFVVESDGLRMLSVPTSVLAKP